MWSFKRKRDADKLSKGSFIAIGREEFGGEEAQV